MMADIEKVKKALQICVLNDWDHCRKCPYWHEDCDDEFHKDILEVIEEQKKEIEELNKRLRIMYNRCISFRGADDCGDCVQKEKCESTRNMWRGWHLKNRERVRDGEQ